MPKKKKKTIASSKSIAPKPFLFFWIGFLGFLLISFLFYLVIVYGNKHAINIGIIAEKGTSSMNAANVFVDQTNASGGLLVHGSSFPVKLTIRDNGVTSTQTQQNTQSLIDEGVLGIIGPKKSQDMVSSQGVLFISSMCGTTCTDPFTPNTQNETFISAYKKTYGKVPDQAAGITYMAIQEIFAAIQKNEGFDREGIIQSAGQ